MWNMDRAEERKFKFVRIKTHVLKVHIHCQGCMHKVKKLLRKVEGVYDVKIELGEHKVTVSGKVDCARLIDKLVKSGKHAEIWTPPGGNWLKQETYLNEKDHSLMDDHDFSKYHPLEGNIPSLELGSYLKNNHDAGAYTGEYMWGQLQDNNSDEDSVEYNTSNPGYYAPGQFDGFKNIYEATPGPVYKYQYQFPAAMDNTQGLWNNHYYPAAMDSIQGSWHNHYYPAAMDNIQGSGYNHYYPAAMDNIQGSRHNHYYPAAMDNIQGLWHNHYYPYSKVYGNMPNMQHMPNMMQPFY